MACESDTWWDDNDLEEEGEFGDMVMGLGERGQVSRVRGRACSYLEGSGTSFPQFPSRGPPPLAQPLDPKPVVTPSFSTGEIKAQGS